VRYISSQVHPTSSLRCGAHLRRCAGTTPCTCRIYNHAFRHSSCRLRSPPVCQLLAPYRLTVAASQTNVSMVRKGTLFLHAGDENLDSLRCLSRSSVGIRENFVEIVCLGALLKSMLPVDFRASSNSAGRVFWVNNLWWIRAADFCFPRSGTPKTRG